MRYPFFFVVTLYELLNQGDQEEHQKYEEQDTDNTGGRAGNSSKPQCSGNDGDNKKYQHPA